MIAHIIWIVTIVTIISFYAVHKLHEKSIQEHLQNDAAHAAEIVESIMLQAMKRNDLVAVQDMLPELSKLHHVKQIRIVQPSGRIVFSSNPQEKGTVLDGASFNNFVKLARETITTKMSTGGHTIFRRLRKLNNEEICQDCHGPDQKINGISWVETSDSISLASMKTNLILITGIALGVIILLSVATEALFIRSVDRPVQELTKMMNALQRGDFSTRLTTIGRDELGQLATGMNTMAQKLQEARNVLLEHHRQEMLQAESLAKIGELAAGMAHEIKNPISGIVFAANSILRELDPKDNRHEIFEEIVTQANRVEQNLESLLTFARQSRLERFPTDLNAIIERILLFIRQQPDMKLIKAESVLDVNLPEVLVDPKQIEQVFLNLIINAVQAMPDGGRLTVSTRTNQANNTVCIAVQDTGVGISEELRDQIFQPFYTTKVNGVGLGLALCKEIVTRHNGTISFESEVGIGTTFTVELPIGSWKTL
jgi:signal transduction histidine kinase